MGKATASAVARASEGGSVPTIPSEQEMVGTALVRLCPPCERAAKMRRKRRLCIGDGQIVQSAEAVPTAFRRVG